MKDSEGKNETWRAAAGLAVFYALVVLMNAPAMEKNAENMDYGVARDAAKALVRPVARLSAMFRLDFLRRGAARVRGRWLDQDEKETTMTTDKNNFFNLGATAPGFKSAARLRGEKEDVVFTSCLCCFQKNL